MTISREAAERAADAFMEKFTGWAGARYRSETAEDMRAAGTEIVSMLEEVAPAGRVQAFRAAVDALFAEGQRFVRAHPPGSVWTLPPERLEPAWAALDDALAPFDDALINDARDQVRSATQELDRLRRRLVEAVERADVGAIRGLRDEVEMTGPDRVAAARASLRELEVARARAVLKRPAQRAAIVRDEWVRARETLEAAERAVVEAEKANRVARDKTMGPFHAESAAVNRVRGLERAAAEQAAADEAERRARVLQLTGLPAGTAVSARATSIAARNRAFEAELIDREREPVSGVLADALVRTGWGQA